MQTWATLEARAGAALLVGAGNARADAGEAAELLGAEMEQVAGRGVPVGFPISLRGRTFVFQIHAPFHRINSIAILAGAQTSVPTEFSLATAG